MKSPLGPNIPSRGIPTLRGPLLSDKRIEHYIRSGRYGEEARLRLLAAEARHKKSPRPRPLAPALNFLKKLL